MAYDFYVMLLSDEPRKRVSLITQRETAELFGWDKAFPEWTPVTHTRPDGSTYSYMHMGCGQTAAWKGGHRLRICRSKKKTGSPGGMTQCFRLKGPWNNRHLVAMAASAGEKFEWMEAKYGQRVDRDEWLAWADKRNPPPGFMASSGGGR